MINSLRIGESKVVTAYGRQLIIVDVQKCFKDSSSLLKKLIDYMKGFDDILYIYDTQMHYDEDPVFHDMFKELKDSGAQVRMKKISKEYGFFRGYMDTSVSEKDLIKIIQHMIKKNITDSRDIKEGKFKIVDENSDNIYLPELYDDLKNIVKSRPILVGGGRDECLKEVYLLLKAMKLRPEINEKHTY